MLHEEGLERVFARHHRLAEATRAAVRAWGLEIMCRDAKFYSPTVTAVMLPAGHDGDAFRSLALEMFNISYGASFGPYAGKYFRIGHLGDVNDGMLLGALATTSSRSRWRASRIAKAACRRRSNSLVSAHASASRAAAE